MDDPNNVPRDFLFGVLTSYVGSCLFAVVSLFAAWLAPRTLRTLRWLRAGLRSRDVTIQLKGQTAGFRLGSLSASVSATALSPPTITAVTVTHYPATIG